MYVCTCMCLFCMVCFTATSELTSNDVIATVSVQHIHMKTQSAKWKSDRGSELIRRRYNTLLGNANQPNSDAYQNPNFSKFYWNWCE